jgi:hypothetical protein
LSDLNTIESTRLEAEFGDPEAQFMLGAAYDDGKGVENNEQLAFYWYSKAAEQGDVSAQFMVGMAYEDGLGVEQDIGLAVEWYRKAADQGDGDAQYNLGWAYHYGRGVDQNLKTAKKWYMKAAEQEIPDAKARIEELENMPLDQRIRTRERKGNNRRCPELLELSTPEVYRNNPFRITGLTVDAAPSKIKRRIDDLKNVEEMGDAEEEHEFAYAFVPPPSLEKISAAAQDLKDPAKRMVYEFFWFWPENWGDGKKDPALKALEQDDKDTAYNLWRTAITQPQGRAVLVAKHNLAVMYQLAALDSEREAMSGEMDAIEQNKLSKFWRTCFKWWEELTEDENFWSLVTERIRLVDDPQLNTGFARRMQGTLPEAMDKINALQALAFIECGKHHLAEQHIEYMLETHEGQDDVEGTMALVSEPLFNRIKSAVEHARSTSKNQPDTAYESAMNLVQMVTEPIQILDRFLPSDDIKLTDASDAIADACLQCYFVLARKGDGSEKMWDQALYLLGEAESFLVSETLSSQIEKEYEAATRQKQSSHPKVKRIANLAERALSETMKKQLNTLGQDIESELMDLYVEVGGQSVEYQTAVDQVGGVMRNISIEIINKGQSEFELLTKKIELFKKNPYFQSPLGESHKVYGNDGLIISSAVPMQNSLKDPQVRAMELEEERWVCFMKFAVGLDLYDRGKKLAHSADLKKQFESDSKALCSIRDLCKQVASELYKRRRDAGLLFTWGSEYPKPPPLPKATQSSSSSNSGCFVATAVYGSYDHPAVQVLRFYRDEKLLFNPGGRVFVKFYYRIGPALAASIGRNQLTVSRVRQVLDWIVLKIKKTRQYHQYVLQQDKEGAYGNEEA